MKKNSSFLRFSDSNDKKSNEGFESPLGYHGVDVEGVTLGDSPTADTMMRGMPDFSASTGSLGSGARPMAKQMTVTYVFFFLYSKYLIVAMQFYQNNS